MEIGDIYINLECESFLDKQTNRVRVRPLQNQNIETNIVIECSREVREVNPIGTKFYCEEAKVCKKTDGRLYLRAKDQMIHLLEE
jgi:hypothetical protein